MFIPQLSCPEGLSTNQPGCCYGGEETRGRAGMWEVSHLFEKFNLS